MRLSDEQIEKLMDWFCSQSKTREWIIERVKEQKKNHKWLQPDIIKKMEDEKLREKFEEYYRTGAGRQNLNQIYRGRVLRDPELKNTLINLLDEDKNSIDRLDNVLSGDKHIVGFGRAIATSVLMDFKPEKYCLWNGKTMMGFSALGIEIPTKGLSNGEIYSKAMKELKRLIQLKPGFNFLYIDLFLHTIAAEDEGIDVLNTITQGLDISIDPHMSVDELKNMEFVMEKYLEEFIESNFDKIDFGVKLELYQDEENTGRQYSTTTGYIDLLAIDQETKEFVVIELKKGKTSDAVVGQILRYMSWVQENLADNKPVKGIIIAKEKDKNLEYALKLTNNIDLFLYNVNFNIEKIT